MLYLLSACLFVYQELSSKIHQVIMMTMFALIVHACVERSGLDGTAFAWKMSQLKGC